MRENRDLSFQLGDTVQILDGTYWSIENIRNIPAKGNLYTLKNNIGEYKSYYEAKMFTNAFVVQFSDGLNAGILNACNKDTTFKVENGKLVDTNVSAPKKSNWFSVPKFKSKQVDTRPLAKVYILEEYRVKRIKGMF